MYPPTRRRRRRPRLLRPPPPARAGGKLRPPRYAPDGSVYATASVKTSTRASDGLRVDVVHPSTTSAGRVKKCWEGWTRKALASAFLATPTCKTPPSTTTATRAPLKRAGSVRRRVLALKRPPTSAPRPPPRAGVKKLKCAPRASVLRVRLPPRAPFLPTPDAGVFVRVLPTPPR